MRIWMMTQEAEDAIRACVTKYREQGLSLEAAQKVHVSFYEKARIDDETLMRVRQITNEVYEEGGRG